MGVPDSQAGDSARFPEDVDRVLSGSHWVLRTFVWTQFLLLELSPLFSKARLFSWMNEESRRIWMESISRTDRDLIRGMFLLIKTLAQAVAYTKPAMLSAVGRAETTGGGFST